MRNKLAGLAALTVVFLSAFFVDDVLAQQQDPFGEVQDQPVERIEQEVFEFLQPTVNSAGVQVGLVNGTQLEQQAYAALDRNVSFVFIDSPLVEVLSTMSERLGIPMIFNSIPMEDIGVSTEVRVTIELDNVPLRTFLAIMLTNLDLTYTIDGLMTITTQEDAEERLRVRMYRIPDKLKEKSEQVIKTLQETVAVDTWSSVGGPSVAVVMDNVLIVSTTTCVHVKVEGFLSTFVAMHGSAEGGVAEGGVAEGGVAEDGVDASAGGSESHED